MLQERDGVREVQAQLDDYVRRLGGRLSLESVVVTGSRARNTHMRKSDVDLVVVSADFEGMRRLDRIDVLLDDWYDTPDDVPPLEPLGFTPQEILEAHTLYLWDALADGRVILDRGAWGAARTRFNERCEQGELTRTERGWRFKESTRQG